MEEIKKTKYPSSEEYLTTWKIKTRGHIVQVIAVKFDDLKGMISTDQTEVFPATLAHKTKYIVAMVNSDASPILATVIKS